GEVSSAFADRAVALSENARAGRGDLCDRAAAASIATNAVTASGSRGSQGQRDLIERLGPTKSKQLVDALALGPARLLDGGGAALGSAASEEERVAAADGLLAAAGKGSPSEASNAVVDEAFATVGSRALEEIPTLGPDLGKAIATSWYSNDP